MSNQIISNKLTSKEKQRLVYLIVVKKLKYKDVAKKMGGNWTTRAVQHRAAEWEISNHQHGGQRAIPQVELDFQKKLMDLGWAYGAITMAMNKKFGTHYTRSTISARAKARNWPSQTVSAGVGTKYSKEEIQKIKTLYNLGVRTPASYMAVLPNRTWSGVRKKISYLLIDKELSNVMKINTIINDNLLKYLTQGERNGKKA